MSIHIVESGQTLSKIAKQYNGDPSALAKLNKLKQCDCLKPGQALLIEDISFTESQVASLALYPAILAQLETTTKQDPAIEQAKNKDDKQALCKVFNSYQYINEKQ